MAKKLKILTNPNPLLRRKGRDLSFAELTSPKMQEFIGDMIKTMYEADGVGLAAPQVGKSVNLAVIAVKGGELVLVNPKVKRYGFLKEKGEEGCLSVPGVWGIVKRSKSIKVKAMGLDGKTFEFKAAGFFARVIQHEVDHLNGILFIDKAQHITNYVLGKAKKIQNT